eukprot:m.178729 g.178729  ORF g.178729 m.178729 type:complete len:247 (+) comp14930_c0_seq5:3479-4219(+)
MSLAFVLVGAAAFATRTEGCNVTGYWSYIPEPGYVYTWVEDGDSTIKCFTGNDGWLRGSGVVATDGVTVTLTFADQACPGAAPMKPITKSGVLDSTCSVLTMNDTQPNCPTAGSCAYRRVPPPPPPPTPCVSNSSAVLDVEWLRCRAAGITAGCREPIAGGASNPTNRGINATYAYTPDATHSYGAQWTRCVWLQHPNSATDPLTCLGFQRFCVHDHGSCECDGPDRGQKVSSVHVCRAARRWVHA